MVSDKSTFDKDVVTFEWVKTCIAKGKLQPVINKEYLEINQSPNEKMSTEAKSKVVMMLSQAEPSGKPSIGPFIMGESKDSSQISVQHRLSKKRSQQGEESKLS